MRKNNKLCAKLCANILIKSRYFSLILCAFCRLFSLKKLRTKKKSSLTFVHVLIDFSTHNILIGKLKYFNTH